MKSLKHEWIKEEIVLENNRFTILILENQKFFRIFIFQLEKQIREDEEFLVFSEDLKPLLLSKEAVLITDLFLIPFDEKKAITLIYKDLEKKMNEDLRIGLNKVNSIIGDYLSDITYDYFLPLTFDDELSLASLLKLTNVRPDYDTLNYLDALIKRIKMISVLLKKNIFFLVNLHDLLDEEELKTFYHEMNLLHIDVVVIDAHEPKTKLEDYEKIIIIDKDLCEILK